MNKSESKYLNTARLMDEALISILDKKDFEYITVKEVCKKAGVNRSTFYLHYEGMGDLLDETAKYLNDLFLEHMAKSDVKTDIIKNIPSSPLKELRLVTPEYVIPYLEFIYEHKKLFMTSVKVSGLLKLDKAYNALYKNVLEPIMIRFNIDETERGYVIDFYVHGLIAIVTRWIKRGFSEPVQKIADIIVAYGDK